MAFVTVQDATNPAISPLTGIFNFPQNEPVPEGYIGHIEDTDPRIATFLNSQGA